MSKLHLSTFLSQAAPKVVKMTTSGISNDENVVKMTTVSFQCRSWSAPSIRNFCTSYNLSIHLPPPQTSTPIWITTKNFLYRKLLWKYGQQMAAMLLTLQSANPQVSSAERYLIGLYTVLLKLEETLVCKLNFNSLRPSDAYLRK